MSNVTPIHKSAGALEAVLQHPAVWRAAHAPLNPTPVNGLATGYTRLDQLLPQGGWPAAELVEFLCPQWGVGELQLLVATLARLSRQSRWIVLVAPPWIPYAPALADCGIALEQLIIVRAGALQEQLWALEQSLASGACSAVLGWPQAIQPCQVRRLQLAAQKGGCLGVILRPGEQLQQASPAPLRLELGLPDAGLRVRIVKCRGAWGSSWLHLPWRALPMPLASDGLPQRSAQETRVTAVPSGQCIGTSVDGAQRRRVSLERVNSSRNGAAAVVRASSGDKVAAAAQRPG